MGPALLGVLSTLKEMGALPDEGQRISNIIRRFEFVTRTPIAELTGKSQAAPITELRHQLMYVIRNLVPEASYSSIGRFIGGRDMATVHEAVSKVRKRAETDPDYGVALDRTLAAIERIGDLPRPTSTAKPWQLLAAAQVLRDEHMTDAEARKVALSFIEQLEASHA